MPRPNFYEEAQKGVLEEIQNVSKSIAEDFKGTYQYEKREPNDAELYMALTQLDDVEKAQLQMKHGELWLDFLYRMKKFERRIHAR